MKRLAEEFDGRARFVKVDADREGRLRELFASNSFPTYLVFRDGVEVDRLTLNFIELRLESRLRGMVEGALPTSR